MHLFTGFHGLSRGWSHAPWRLIRATIAIVVVAFISPTLSFAQQTMNAQSLTAEGIALTVAELGPEWSLAHHRTDTAADGSNIYNATYTSPSGRGLVLTTVVASSAELAEGVLSEFRYDLESGGMTISSVQSDGFGDGRAFKAQCQCKGNMISIAYLFRVRNLMTVVDYIGLASASDTQTQAVAFARKQEAKLFAAFAPPPPPTPTPVPAVLTPVPMPTPVPTPTPLPASEALVVTAPPLPAVSTAPHCQSAEQPQFRFGFATLSTQLGPAMGNPTSCEYIDPSGSGDTLQTTDSGLAIYRRNTGTATFTNGSEHWALVGSAVMYWSGDSIDPTDGAEPWAV